MIIFQEHSVSGYSSRTYKNAKLADVTIAFAIDFSTSGEILTKKVAANRYYPVLISDLLTDINKAAHQFIKCYNFPEIKCLNIAGNGIYTLQRLCSQKFIDDLIFNFLSIVKLNFEHPFSIRSGGQTGADEAALKAGDRLGLKTICLAPKGWIFRDNTGQDICDEALFLKRFGDQYDITDLL